MVKDRSSETEACGRHVHFMRMALDLAEKGRWSAPPNPAVGAVVVAGGSIVGEGYHLRPGTPHAEVVALEEAGDLARDATIYVSLEPCDHHGRTPPCTDAIIEAGIKRVVIPCIDPSPSVSGRGLARLRAAGIEVVENVECIAARRLNARHFKATGEGRPGVVAKIARTLDGRTALPGPATLAVTGEQVQEYVGRRRSEVDAVMVGVGTVLADDPLLSARTGEGELLPRQPVRVVVDTRLRTPPEARMLYEPGGRILIMAGQDMADSRESENLTRAGASIVSVPGNEAGGIDTRAMLKALAAEAVESVLVEGGGKLLHSLAEEDCIDFWQIWIAPKIIGAGRGVIFAGLEAPIRLGPLHTMAVGDDLLVSAWPESS